MSKKPSPLTKAELQEELQKFVDRIITVMSKKLDSFHLDKRLDKIDIKIDLTFEEFQDILTLVKYDHDKIKELEKRVEELSDTHTS